MYRGSRLAASFLLFLTGSAATAIAFGVAPAAVGGAWPLALLVIVFGIAHFVALFGIARGREWGRRLAITIARSAAASRSPAWSRSPSARTRSMASRSRTARASSRGRWRCTSCSGSAPVASGSTAGSAAPPGGHAAPSGRRVAGVECIRTGSGT